MGGDVVGMLRFLLLRIWHKIVWRKQNKHNDTYCVEMYDLNCVKVGKATYGPLDVHMGRHDTFLFIGNYCSIAKGVKFILSSNHPVDHISTFPFHSLLADGVPDTLKTDSIVVDDDVWLGYNVTILSGVMIGPGAVVAAGSVVAKDVPPYAVVAGVPARVIKYRFEEDMIRQLLKIDYSKLDEKSIRENLESLYEPLHSKEQLEWLLELSGQ